MKKILITCLSLAFFFTSCEFDKGFEEMNVNPNSASQVGVATKITKLQTDISGSRYEKLEKQFDIQFYNCSAPCRK